MLVPRGDILKALLYLAIAAPDLLPSKSESKKAVVSYNPQRVLRQLGYDKWTMMISWEMGNSSMLNVETRFIRDRSDQILANLKEMFLPSQARAGVRSPSGAMYWKEFFKGHARLHYKHR